LGFFYLSDPLPHWGSLSREHLNKINELLLLAA